MKKIFLLLPFLAFLLSGYAGVRLPAIIGSHMVLQQKSRVKIWGWCEPLEKITVRAGWDTTTYTATGTPEAKWECYINTPAAGGPYAITIAGQDATIALDDVMTGEVWLCSGQSNMEMSVSWGMPKYEDDVKNATNNKIRFFYIPHSSSATPQEDLKARWVVCTPDEMRKFSAVGYFFGERLQTQLGAPVGLISACWSGSPAEIWTPEPVVTGNALLNTVAKAQKPSDYWPAAPGRSYNAMINPITSYAIAGAIWYQGESNTGAAATYEPLLTAMIDAWRKAWHLDFPFYLVQIAPYHYETSNIAALLREAQTKIATYPKTGLVVTTDLVDNINDIHPRLKKDVGLRLANYALGDTYGKPGPVYKSPSFMNMQVEKDKIRVRFDNAPKGLLCKGPEPSEFFIAGADGKFFPATAKIDGSTVVVSNSDVKAPVAVRFGFSNAAMPNLFSAEGLPVTPFRTDNWTVETGPAQH